MGKIALKRGQPIPDTAEGIASLGYRVVRRGDKNLALSPFVMDEDTYQTDLSKEAARNPKFGTALEEAQALAIASGVTREIATDPSFQRRVFTFTGSTEAVDRYGSRVLVDGVWNGKKYGTGWDLGPFRANPVIMPFHQYETFPVGRALDVWTDKKIGQKRLRFQVLFGDGGVSPLAPLFVNAFATREMRSVSVGWWPHKIHVPETDEEAKTLGVDPRWGVLFASNELWELSPVAIPGNPEALADGAPSPDVDEFVLPEERESYLRLAERADSVLPSYSAQIRSSLHYDPKATVVVPGPVLVSKIPATAPTQEGAGGGSEGIQVGGAEELLHAELDAMIGRLEGAATPSVATEPIAEPSPAPDPDPTPAPDPAPEPEPEPVAEGRSVLMSEVQDIVDRAVAPLTSSLTQVLTSLETMSARLEAIGTSTHRGAPLSDPLYDDVLRVADEAIAVTRASKRTN